MPGARSAMPLLAVGTLCGALSTPLFPAGLPDWAQDVASAARPPGGEETRSAVRVLLRDSRMSVKPDGSLRLRLRIALQAMKAGSDQTAFRHFGFGDGMKIQSSRGWHLPPDGEAERASRQMSFDVAMGEHFLDDAKFRVVPIFGVKRSSLIFFEFEASDSPYTMTHREWFAEEGPVSLARFELETPPGWSVRSAWLRRQGPEPEIAGNIRRWEIRDLPGPEDEPLGEAIESRAPILVLNLAPPPGAAIEPAVLTDWSAVARWYGDLARNRAAVTPEILAAAGKVAPPESETLDRIRAAALMVRDSVRYVAREVGIGGYQPHAAAETLHNRFGDCKDKSTLYQSILHAMGLASHPVLVNLGLPEAVSTQIASAQSFNHQIVAVPLPEDLTVPEPVAHALIPVDGLGRLLFVDTTDENSSFGSIPAALAGGRGLVVADGKGVLVTLPGEDPLSHRVQRHLKMELLSDRSLSAVLRSEYFGQPAASARGQHRRSSKERREEAEQEVVGVWQGAGVTNYAVDVETADGKFVETMNLKLAPLAHSGPAAWVKVFPFGASEVPRVPLSRRRSAVVYDSPLSVRYEVSLRGIPGSLQPPGDRRSEGAGWSVSTEYRLEPPVLGAVLDLRLSRRRFEPADLEELRRLWAAIDAATRTIVDLSG